MISLMSAVAVIVSAMYSLASPPPSRTPFDHDAIAAAISVDSTKYTGVTLPFASTDFVDDEKSIGFSAAGFGWRCVVATSQCTKGAPVAGGGRGGRGGSPWVDEAPMP